MQANFTIRTAKPEDRPTLVKLMELLQEAERQLHVNRPPGSEISDAHLAYLEELASTQNGQIYVAESKVGILGFVVCFVETLEEGDRHVVETERAYGYISDLYVVSEMRQQGVAAALMQAVEQYFLGLDLTVVRVSLLCSNELAAQFYRKVGYQPYEIVYEKPLNAL
jgi:ribosomal protein S18 acetylase RimI-like enzyme